MKLTVQYYDGETVNGVVLGKEFDRKDIMRYELSHMNRVEQVLLYNGEIWNPYKLDEDGSYRYVGGLCTISGLHRLENLGKIIYR